MDEDRNQLPSEDQTAAERIGLRLRSRRESMNLTLEDAAKQLHLDVSVLRALEEDDFPALPGPAYIKGYLRSYAQMLGMDSQELIHSYQSTFLPSEPELKPAVSYSPEYMGQRGRSYAIGSAVALVLILLAAWWYAHSHATHTPPMAKGADQMKGPQTAMKPISVAPAMPIASTSLPPSTTVSPQSRAMLPSTTTKANTSLPIPASPPAASPTATPSRSTTSAVNVAPAGENPVDELRLVLTLTHRSWVQIDDAKHHQLAYGLLPAGTHQVLQGTPPFSVFLGYAQGVQLKLDGHAVDMTPYIRSNHTARFHLNASPGGANIKSSP